MIGMSSVFIVVHLFAMELCVDCAIDSKTEECQNADKNVDRSVPLTTAGCSVHHSGC